MRYFIIYLYIIVFLCLLYVINKHKYNSVKGKFHDPIIYRDNLIDYRLGDVVKNTSFRNIIGPSHLTYFPDSIASSYIRGIIDLPGNEKNNNIPLLHKIINQSEYQKYKNNENNICLHLRAGDVIDKQPYTVDEFLESEKLFQPANKYNYVKPLIYYKNVCDIIDTLQVEKKITMISGFHTEHDYSKSLDFIYRIGEFFTMRGYEVITLINRHPDKDFTYLSTSKYFIPGGGGFSKLIKQMVTHNNGTVINLI